MLYYFYGRPDRLLYFGELMGELRIRARRHLGMLECVEPKRKGKRHK